MYVANPRIGCLKLLLAIALLVAIPCQGAGVYKWIDKNGKVHFGDRPPADGAEEVDIKSSPTGGATNTVPSAEERRERQRRLLEAYETDRARKKAIAEKEKEERKTRKLECARARDELRAMTNAGYLYDVDEEGNRVIYSDAERQQAIDKLKRQIKENCG